MCIASDPELDDVRNNKDRVIHDIKDFYDKLDVDVNVILVNVLGLGRLKPAERLGLHFLPRKDYVEKSFDYRVQLLNPNMKERQRQYDIVRSSVGIAFPDLSVVNFSWSKSMQYHEKIAMLAP